jgi:hypothetical protein
VAWREERRKDKAAAARQRRNDLTTTAEIEIRRIEAAAAARRDEDDHKARLRAQKDRDKAQRARDQARIRDLRRQRRRTRRANLRRWAGEHVVDLLIYPLAAVSALMAVPAMAAFGHDVYGDVTGVALPVITELGMWAFAIAVQYTHHHRPDRPVWALQLGVWSFATVAASLNFLHGLTSTDGLRAGVVMAVASVAGVMAHQLVTAAPRRSRAERHTIRMARRAARKVARVRRAAVRAAVAHIEPDGSTRLVFTPGHYELKGTRLTSAHVPGLPVSSASETGWDELDRELAEVLAGSTRPRSIVAPIDPPQIDPTASIGSASIDTLDPTADQPKSTSTGPDDRPQDRPPTPRSSRRSRRVQQVRQGRSIEVLRAELRKLIEDDPGSIDVTSAESIRRALRCSPARARQLRDEHPQS